MIRWIFVRHGESEANLLREFSNRGDKHGLTSLGVCQATTLLASVKSDSIDLIFSSPLRRARQTAAILGAGLGITPQVSHALIEFDTGILEGRSDENSWNLYYEIIEEWLVQKNHQRQFPQGDSFTSIARRFLPFISSQTRQYANQEKTILCVGHGGTFLCMLPLILSNIDHSFALAHRLGNTGRVIATEINGELICQVWEGRIIIEP